jgi:ubiquinone/menaquinone biosynthesis C-methylase UbiE
MFEHLHRYAIAKDICKGKIVLDIASGEGYGSAFIASTAKEVTGVDLDQYAVEDAIEKYKMRNLVFKQGSATDIPLDDNSVEMVISFETLEHHNMHEEMMKEVKRVLKPDGMLVISTPDKLIYSDKKNYQNKYHVKELYEKEFKNLVQNEFKYSAFFKQRAFFASMITPEDVKNTDAINFYKGNYSSLYEESGLEAEYLIAFASDEPIVYGNSSLFIDEDFSNKLESKIKNSTRYKFGNFFLNPIGYFKKNK